ncbi:MAG: Rne/Rng family ribonuclease, partial [Gammaproteobacteria bacterium]
MKRMLINATQPEELRVAIVDGQKLYDLDIEVPGHGQKKANIYKGRVARVEPSLEACFVDYGAERHGFLSLREIAPAYHHGEAEAGARLTIKEAISEGQEVIVQMAKEERGSKGAALTTYISLAGRYLVLMPNDPGAGGISGRIEGADRDAIRAILAELAIPKGMGVIVRTAGGGRSGEQLQWDLDYLDQVWKAINEAAEKRAAPFLLYQESNVIIRALRDHFTADIGEVIVDSETMLEEARAFVEMVMPQHLAKLKLHEDKVPLFTRFQIESQIDAAYQRQVRLPSGGSVVLDQTEALVAVDVNSARATQGSDINETALNTNLEAAEEVARQLRLRDIGGLVVVDFIDMNATRNLRQVEQKLRDALALDRARIQIGRISRFGLLEMSRQRLRPALSEAVFEPCPRCAGKGNIRSVESLAISVLRLIQEEALKERTARVIAEVPVEVATYLMNEKRVALVDSENRMGVGILVVPNPHMNTPNYRVERIRSDQLGHHEEPSHLLVETPEAPPVPEKPAPMEKPAVSALRPPTPPPALAPVVKPRTGTRGGWFARLLGRLGSTEQESTPSVSSTPAPARKRASNNRGRRTQTTNSSGTRSRRQRPVSSNTGSRPRGGAARGSNDSAPRGRAKSAGSTGGNGKTEAGKPKAPPASEVKRESKSSSTQSTAGEGGKTSDNKTETNGGSSNNRPRSRTRRGRRGGRRHRGAGSGGGNRNEDDATHNTTQSGQPDTRQTSSEAPSSVRGTNTGAAGSVAPPPAEDTPRLAALFE